MVDPRRLLHVRDFRAREWALQNEDSRESGLNRSGLSVEVCPLAPKNLHRLRGFDSHDRDYILQEE